MPNVKIELWFTSPEIAKQWIIDNSLVGWQMQRNGQRVYIKAPSVMDTEDWGLLGESIGVIEL